MNLEPSKIPVKNLTESEERTWAMIAHCTSFILFIIPVANIIVSYIMWKTYDKSSSYVSEHARRVLNFQISWLLITIACIPFIIIFGLGYAMIAVVNVAYACLAVLGAIAAYNNRPFKYRLTKKFFSPIEKVIPS